MFDMNRSGKDLHRVYFIAYHGSETLVANTRDESTLEAWVQVRTGVRGITKAGIYQLENGEWVFAQELTGAGSKAVRVRNTVTKTPPFNVEARSALLDLVRAHPQGMRSSELVGHWKAQDASRYKRQAYRYLGSFVRLGLVTRHPGPGVAVIYRPAGTSRPSLPQGDQPPPASPSA